MKVRLLFLVLASFFVLSRPCLADSVGASGTYEVSGNVTMVGTIIGPCGSSPCVESLDFSFLVLATSFFDFESNTTLYEDAIVGGPGVTSASGPLGSPWEIGFTQGYSLQAYIAFVSDSLPGVEIDAFGFHSPAGIPHSISGPDALFYPGCFDASGHNPVCPYFGGSILGTETIIVRQATEPNSLLLTAIGGLSLLAIVLRNRKTARRWNCSIRRLVLRD